VPRFKKEFGGLLYALRAKWPEARVVWSPVLEFTRAPAMPPLLGKILEIRAAEMNRMGVRLCLERGAVAARRACRSPMPKPALRPMDFMPRKQATAHGADIWSARCWVSNVSRSEPPALRAQAWVPSPASPALRPQPCVPSPASQPYVQCPSTAVIEIAAMAISANFQKSLRLFSPGQPERLDELDGHHAG